MSQPQQRSGKSAGLGAFIVAIIAVLGYFGAKSRFVPSGQPMMPVAVRDQAQNRKATSANPVTDTSTNLADQEITSTYRAWLGRVKRNEGLNSGRGNLFDANNKERDQLLVLDTVVVSGNCVTRIGQLRSSASASGQAFADRVTNQIREWCDMNMYPGALDNSPLPPAPTGPGNPNDFLPSGKTTDYGDLLK